ncbi:MAG: hypothetical protein LBU27_03745 [Candidatus Peribacteria bacterium]|jgi:hypothetical protein|nr:hypothetical protein [Candidatus Peribacteria bacterium]
MGKERGFGGLFGKLAQMAMTPEYLAELKEQQAAQEAANEVPQQVQPSEARKATVQPPGSTIPGSTVFASSARTTGQGNVPVSSFTTPAVVTPEMTQEMIQKMYDFLEKINKPGVDFLEFWNGVEAMKGGITADNIYNAFAAIKMMSGGSVSKDSLISTGNDYVVELTQAIESDIAGREKQKVSLQNQLNTEKLTLETEVNGLEQEVEALEEQIKQKRVIISQKRANAGQIAEKYLPQMQEIDLRIVSGKTALSMVIQEMKQFISQIQTVITE